MNTYNQITGLPLRNYNRDDQRVIVNGKFYYGSYALSEAASTDILTIDIATDTVVKIPVPTRVYTFPLEVDGRVYWGQGPTLLGGAEKMMILETANNKLPYKPGSYVSY